MEMRGTGSRHGMDRTIKYSLKTASVIVDEVLQVIYASPNVWNKIDLDSPQKKLDISHLD
jgi:hypothetical protein